MSEYAWIYLNKQDYEYALGPKLAKILQIAKTANNTFVIFVNWYL